ncbi:hypothetical protein RF55_15625 [Lasius niger]|uniref:Reverse transcriptase domain-containing protein n=1 Tax=Lasius niger TaxID=67767 RepID=A0A0J7K5P4_LASNI|nr:hypothetical protein RF55_15625 [Lasius niger]
MLIGAEYFYQLLCIGQIKLKTGTTILQRTRFGWVVTRKIYSPSQKVNNLCHLSRSTLENAVQRFWETEELPTRKILSPEEEDCEKYYKQTLEKLSSGHYAVGLPFNTKKDELGESYKTALTRFQGLEKRLTTDAKLYEEYRSFLKEYENLGHMTRVEDTDKQNEYFLPHHAVVKNTSTTTRLRVVFDASAKTTSGVSLNDTLLTGPVVQQNLFSIVTRFRLHNIVFTADIKKMFRQVFIRKDDRQYQKILWRNNPEEVIQIYKLNAVTYGMSSSPYLATRTVQQVAADERQTFPEATDIITKDMYVDDLLTGAETVKRTQTLKTQISGILSRGGFNLRKWASNHPQLNERSEQTTEEPICFDFSDVHKTLGIL